MAIKIRCPDCNVVIKSARPIAEGKRIRCPRCEHIFPFSSTSGMTVPAQRRTGIDLDGPQAKHKIDEASRNTRLDVGSSPRRRKTKVDTPAPKVAREPKPLSATKAAPARPKKISEPQRDAPAPQRNAPQRRSSKLRVIMACAGTVLLVTAIAFAAWFNFPQQSTSGNSLVSLENMRRLQIDMPKSDVVALLGQGTPLDETALTNVVPAGVLKFDPVKQWRQVAGQRDAHAWAEWRNGAERILIAFRDGPQGERVGFFVWLTSASRIEFETGP